MDSKWLSVMVDLLTAPYHASTLFVNDALHKKATIHQLSTMLATCKNVLFPGHNHLLITGADVPLLNWCSGNNQSVRSSAPVVSRWL